MTPKHLPPSRRRFELNHPTITTRIAPELHLALVDIAGAKAVTLAEVARDALATFVESDVLEDDEDEQEPAQAPEDHPRFRELTAEVESLRAERASFQQNALRAEEAVRERNRQLSGLKDRVQQAEAALAEIGGPLGMHRFCFRCRHHWHQHRWKGLNKSWLCPRD